MRLRSVPHHAARARAARAAALLVGCAALAGCGGSGGSSGASSASVASGPGCNELRAAEARYHQAAVTLQLQFKDHPLVAAVLASSATLQSSLESFTRTHAGADAPTLERFARGLARQRQVLHALEAGDFKTAARAAQGLNRAILEGTAALERACPAVGGSTQ